MSTAATEVQAISSYTARATLPTPVLETNRRYTGRLRKKVVNSMAAQPQSGPSNGIVLLGLRSGIASPELLDLVWSATHVQQPQYELASRRVQALAELPEARATRQ